MTENKITASVTFLMLCVALGAWAIIGLLVWIPLLVRTTTIFAALVIHSMITGQDPQNLKIHLDSASAFYVSGFRLAVNSLYKPAGPPAKLQTRMDRVVVEILWTAGFWSFVIWLSKPNLLARFTDPVAEFGRSGENWGVVVAFVLALAIGWGLGISNRRNSNADEGSSPDGVGR